MQWKSSHWQYFSERQVVTLHRIHQFLLTQKSGQLSTRDATENVSVLLMMEEIQLTTWDV